MIFLYFSQGVNSTISIIKTKQNCRFTQECIGMEVGTGVRVQSQQMQTSLGSSCWTQGFLHLLHYISLERCSARTLAVEKQVGLSKVLYTPGSEKGNICHGTIFSVSNWILNLRWTPCFGWKRKKLRKKEGKNQTNRRRRKKWTHQCFVQHFCYLRGSKQRRGSGTLGKWMCYLLPRSKLQKLLNCIRMSYRTL